MKVFILTQTTTDYLDDCNEKTIIVGVYDKKEKAEWMIECEIEQHPYATDKTSNSYRTMRFEFFNNKQSIVERTFVEFNIQECEVL